MFSHEICFSMICVYKRKRSYFVGVFSNLNNCEIKVPGSICQYSFDRSKHSPWGFSYLLGSLVKNLEEEDPSGNSWYKIFEGGLFLRVLN